MNTEPLRACSASTTRPIRIGIIGVAMTLKSALSYWHTRAIADQCGHLVKAEYARGNIFAEADFLHRAGFRPRGLSCSSRSYRTSGHRKLFASTVASRS